MKQNLNKCMLSSFFILMLLLCMTKYAGAQYIIKEADAAYELFNYTKAIKLYQQAYEKKETSYTARRLASGYQLTQNYKEAERWREIVLKRPGSIEEDRLNYAIALQHNGKYSEAKLQYKRYGELNNQISSKQKDIWSASCDSAQHWMASPGSVAISAEKSLNSKGSDWGTIIYQGGLVFTSDRYKKQQLEKKNHEPFFKFDRNQQPDVKVYGWTGNSYLNLYEQKRGSQVVNHFSLPVNANYHIASASFSVDEKTVYFALTRIPEKNTHHKKGFLTVNVELFSSQKDERNEWKESIPFKYNNALEYSIGDPFISHNDKILYFVSNMPGGQGGTDIYYCERTKDGEWGSPINMAAINTEGNERSPAVDAAGNFYFSSDGRVGMGGLDIFIAKRSGSGLEFLEIQNMGYPFNSPHDDFSCRFSAAEQGFFASDRSGGIGSDDIYSFHQQKPLSENSTNNLNGANPGLSINGGALIKTGITEPFPREKQKTELTVADIPRCIYYAFSKADISSNAAKELNTLIVFLKDNPGTIVEMRSYTDSRGSVDLNLLLAQHRSDSMVKFLINHGIDKWRISAKAYGKTGLLNKCANGILCSEAEHQMNRRTEFNIAL